MKREIRGRGINIIFNLLLGNLFYVSWKYVAEFNTIIEFKKEDFVSFGKFDLKVFLLNRLFYYIDIRYAIREKLVYIKR